MLDHYHAERVGTKYKDQSTTEIETTSHGSEVCNCRVQRVFFPLLAGSRLRLRRCFTTKKNPLAPRVRNSKLYTRNSKLDSRKHRVSRIEFRVETVNLHLNGTVARAVRTDANFFEQIACTVRTADDFFEQIARAVRTDANFFLTDSSSRSNGISARSNG